VMAITVMQAGLRTVRRQLTLECMFIMVARIVYRKA
jgi:hypothetical protein